MGGDDMTAFRAGIFRDLHIGMRVRSFYAWRRRILVFVSALALSVGVAQWSPLPRFSSAPSIATASAQSKTGNASEGLGANIYNEKCAGCHGKKGAGVPDLFPPLARDPVVTETDPREVIQTVLFGRHGFIIGGVTYRVYMPPWAGELSDEEVAAVINYVRTNWGNNAPAVSPAEVEKIRDEGPP
jgi:mono/diheme cytochrome c family protein